MEKRDVSADRKPDLVIEIAIAKGKTAYISLKKGDKAMRIVSNFAKTYNVKN